MRKFIKNRKAVSEVVGYALSLGLMAIILVSAYVVTNQTLDEKIKITGNIQAGNLADEIADVIINAINTRQNHPNANYSRILTVPDQIANRNYYIKITDSYVFVNSTDGIFSEKSSLYRTPIVNNIDVKDKLYGSTGQIKFTSYKTNYVYKFDFGPAESTSPWHRDQGYTRISNFTKDDLSALPGGLYADWDSGSLQDWKYCTRIKIVNPTDTSMNNYPIMIRLNPSNFDYSKCNSNGSDLLFYQIEGGFDNELDYWIERWNPYNTSTSRIWVNLNTLNADDTYIYMFHGNSDAKKSKSNGKNVFPFFEEFNTSDTNNPNSVSYLNTNWTFNGDCRIEDQRLRLKNTSSGSAIATVENINISNGIIEAKVKATGDKRDISIFARKNYTGGNNWRYIFHNGNSTKLKSGEKYEKYDFNCTVSENYTSLSNPLNQWPLAISSERIPIDTSWNRLVFYVNGSDYVGARYKYYNFEIDAAARGDDNKKSFNCNDGYFGLINQYGEASYVDWIFLRPFIGDTSIPSDSDPKDCYPTAYVGGTSSNNFEWTSTADLATGLRYVSNDLSRDFVSSTSDDGVFTVKYLDPEETYSVVYNIGDTSNDITDMIITANGIDHSIRDLYAGNYSRNFFTVESDSSGEIEFKFSSSSSYWNICSLTIEKGERKIYMEEIA